MNTMGRRHLLGIAGVSLVGSVLSRYVSTPSEFEPGTSEPAVYQPRRDASNVAATSDPGPGADGDIGWIVALRTNDTSDFSGLALDGETLIVPTAEALVGIDIHSGERVWRYRPDRRRRLESSPRVGDSSVFVNTADGVVAVDTEGQRPRWRYRTNATAGTMLLAGTTVCFAAATDGNRYLVGIDTETGNERFRMAGQWADVGTLGKRLVGIRTTTGSDDHQLTALEVPDGTTDWVNSLNDLQLGATSSVAMTDEHIVVTGFRGTAVLEADTGRTVSILESVTTNDAIAVDRHEGRIYATNPGDGLVRAGTLEGDIEWTAEKPVGSGISVGEETVYVGTERGIVALESATGEQRFAVSLEEPGQRVADPQSRPLVVDDRLYHRTGETVFEVHPA